MSAKTKCYVPSCNNKYTRIEKLMEHGNKHHRYTCFQSNGRKLSLIQKQYLVKQLKVYSNIIKRAQGYTMKQIPQDVFAYMTCDGKGTMEDHIHFIWISHQLLPQEYTKCMRTVSRPLMVFMEKARQEKLMSQLTQITQNHIHFCNIMNAGQTLETIFSDADQVDSLMDEWNRFLNIGYAWDGTNFCPSILIDLVWHAAMLDTEMYNKITTEFVGAPLPHCLEENEKQEGRYQIFETVFYKHHNRHPLLVADMKMGHDTDVETVLTNRYKKEAEIQRQIEEALRAEQKRIQEEQERKRQEAIQKEQERISKRDAWDKEYPQKELQNPFLSSYETNYRSYHANIKQKIQKWESENPGQSYPWSHREYGDDGRC